MCGETCKCQDSTGAICNKKMTKEEESQDGMCSSCADHVWMEITAFPDQDYNWKHQNREE